MPARLAFSHSLGFTLLLLPWLEPISSSAREREREREREPGVFDETMTEEDMEASEYSSVSAAIVLRV
jgi:hypothetical protein